MGREVRGRRRDERCSGSDNERGERKGRSGEEEGEKLSVPKFGNNRGELIVLLKL